MAALNNMNVVKANVKMRRRILIFLCGIAIFSWCGIYLSQRVHHTHPFLGYLGNGLILLAAVIAVGLFVFGLWMGRLGVAALQQGCYPPCNSMIMCDTLLVTGWRSTVKALSACMLAAASILGAVGLSLEVVGLVNL